MVSVASHPPPLSKKKFGFVDCDLVGVTIWTVTECFGEFWNVGFSQSKFEFAYEGHAAGLALPKSGQTYFFFKFCSINCLCQGVADVELANG